MTIQTWYLNNLWPTHRRFAKLAKRCSRCIMSEKAVGIVDGLCDECRIEMVDQPMEESAITAADYLSTVDQGREYDYAMLMSGGKDSCYTLARLVNTGKRFILAIMVDNGFTTKEAIENAQEVCQKLGVDFLTVNAYRKYLMDNLAVALKKMSHNKDADSYSLVDFTDGAEVFRVGQVIAKDAGAQMVITGLSREQAKQHGGSLYVDSIFGPVLSPLVEWNTPDADILAYLDEKVGMPASRFDPVRTNHKMIPVMCALDVKRHGYCSFEREFASRIRRGEASREKWLYTFEFLEWATNKGFMDKMIREELGKLNIRMEDLV